MATGSILEIATKITSQIFCETIVSALSKRILMCKRLSNEKFIEVDPADNRNVLTILWGTA